MLEILKKYKKIMLFILLTLFYFSCTVFIFWDSAHYVSFLDILEGNKSWYNWDLVRGIVFPLTIHISNIMFGKSDLGLLLTSYIFYLITLVSIDKILIEFFKEENKKITKTIRILTIIFIIINPIVYGYYHTLLTEYIAMTIGVVMSYISYKFIEVDYKLNKKQFIKYLLTIIVLMLFSYHLKQTYITITLGPLLISVVISIFRKKKLSNTISKLSTIILCTISLILSVQIWNSFLEANGVNLETDRNVTNLLGENIIKNINEAELIDGTSDELNNKYLSKKEINKIEKKPENYYIMNIKEDKKIINQFIIEKDANNVVSTKKAIFTVIKIFIKHPQVVIKSYWSNYLALINLYPKKTNDGVDYYIEKDFSLKYCHENCAIAHSVNDYRINTNYLSEELNSKIITYKKYNNPPIYVNKTLNILEPISEKIFQIIFLLMPITFIINLFLKYIFRKKENILVLDLSLILLGFSIIHFLSCIVAGLIIDRYASPAYITSLIGEILIFYKIVSNIIKGKRGKYERKSNCNNSSIQRRKKHSKRV